MKPGVPWSVKGIRPQARESAKQAARRAGMPLSEWLNSVIINSAAEQGVDADEELFADSSGEELGAVNAKLDALSQRLERLSRGPEAYAPPHLRPAAAAPPAYGPQAYAPPAYTPPAAPVPPPARHWQGGLDTAVAEIAARRRMLNGEPAEPAPARPPAMRPAAPEQTPVFAEPPAIVRAHSV